MKLSVIVPVYNTEQYLERCLNSLVNQTLQELEILVVDDERTLVKGMKFNLENEGYDVDIAFSAEQALTYDLKSYSLILLDIMMGEISGIKMAKMMKAPRLLNRVMQSFLCSRARLFSSTPSATRPTSNTPKEGA